jgi:aspartyl-tRNA(Asn)/glutamyl-tRNA(Gln) amidotransferase subunit A
MSGFAAASEIAASVGAGRRSAVAVIDETLAVIERRNPLVNAFTALTVERARRRAAAVDAAIAAGKPAPPLAGVPFAVKNLIDIAGLPTLAGSRINRDRPPATADATLVAKLEAAGAILVGALNMGEYAYDFTGENCHDGPSRNPHDTARMSGGSSGGSGAAVAGGLVPIALGSDTNGSIRVPSSFCGVFGLKPTYGRLSRAGSFPFVSSFDHLGPLARSVGDLALAYDAMQGHDPADPVCSARPADPVTGMVDTGIAGLRIAKAGDYFRAGASAEALSALDAVAGAVGAVSEIEIPEAARARSAAYVITTAEGAALHLDRLRARPEEFDPEVRDRLIAGALVPASLVVQAQKFRRWYREQVLQLFAQVDAILAPATPFVAPLIGQKTMMLNGEEMPLRPNIGIYTQPVSFIGLPVAVVPLPTALGLPIGVQIIAAPWCEDIALRVARHLEASGIAQAQRPPE